MGLTLGCGHSLGDPNWRQEMWAEIYDRAKNKGKVIDAELGPHYFQYALINPEDGYGKTKLNKNGEQYEYTGKNVTFWIKDAEKSGRIGLNEKGLAFVLERDIPRKDFANYVGLHEWAEANYHPDGVSIDVYDRMIHGHGCKTELGQVLRRKPEFVESYANWLVSIAKKSKDPEGAYFGRAIPNFQNIVKEGKLSPSEILKEFKNQLDKGYHLI